MRVLHSDSSLAVEAGEEEVLEFLSQPVIFSLSINNRTTVLDNASQPVRISFHHKEVSFTPTPGLKRRFFIPKHSPTFQSRVGEEAARYCVFWNYSSQAWSGEGCQVQSGGLSLVQIIKILGSDWLRS